jgi:hypothetical protein
VNRSAIGITVLFIAIGLLAVALGLWIRVIDAPEWYPANFGQSGSWDRPWMVESDCYSQLARVQRILQGQGLIQNHFTVENWPEGLTPSTTAPFDYVILLLYFPAKLFTQYPLDWAGVLVSPALWLALVLFWAIFPSREFNRVGRLLFVVGSAALPAFIWATACGRPRHQSLILALMAVGLTAEYERWHVDLLSPKRAWHIFAGIVWGLACWTSLFEPAFVIIVLVIFNLAVRRRESPAFLISFGVVMLIALILEGPHLYVPPPEYYDALHRWLDTITEVRGLPVTAFAQQMTFMLFILPLLAWGLLTRSTDQRTDWLLIALTFLLCIFAMAQGRWIYYANLAELFLIVRYCQAEPARWSRLAVMAIFLISLADAERVQLEARAGANLPSAQLAQVSRSIDGPGGIMAPWWLSPGLLYFSGQPIVSGSSHCGISGIVDSAKFYSSTSWLEAEKILRDRKVRWVVVMDDRLYQYPLVNTSRGILGKPAYTDEDKGDVDSTVGQILVTDYMAPTWLQLRAVTPQLKLYEYLPTTGK